MVPVRTMRMEYKLTNVDEEQNRRCYDDGAPTIPYYEQPVDLPRCVSSLHVALPRMKNAP